MICKYATAALRSLLSMCPTCCVVELRLTLCTCANWTQRNRCHYPRDY